MMKVYRLIGFLSCQLPKAKVKEIKVINFTSTGHLERFVDLEKSIDENI